MELEFPAIPIDQSLNEQDASFFRYGILEITVAESCTPVIKQLHRHTIF